jgi:hypothetical protein
MIAAAILPCELDHFFSGGCPMALGFYFAPKPPMSAQQYNECMKRLKKAGAGHPRGRVYHASFGSPDNLAVFDVWTNQSAFERFGKTLMPILQELSIDPGQPMVMPMHNVVVPVKAKVAAKKAAPKQRKK